MFYFALNITNRIKAEKKNQLYSEKKCSTFWQNHWDQVGITLAPQQSITKL